MLKVAILLGAVGEYVTIPAPGVTVHTVEVSEAALSAQRFAFNPSANENVTRLKALACAFLSECDRVAEEVPGCLREIAVAKTSMQTAGMWAVLGATTGAPSAYVPAPEPMLAHRGQGVGGEQLDGDAQNNKQS